MCGVLVAVVTGKTRIFVHVKTQALGRNCLIAMEETAAATAAAAAAAASK
jgi:hypothetical protein